SLQRTRYDETRLCACHRGGLPVLFLWRCVLAVSIKPWSFRSSPVSNSDAAVRPHCEMTIAMSQPFSFRLHHTDGSARRGEFVTPHGAGETPAFMPVGTQATVKGLTPDDVRATGAEIVLGNTYHLMLRPGAERIASLGGLHKFMNWPRPILTDSGGFQVMSLSHLRNINAHAV